MPALNVRIRAGYYSPILEIWLNSIFYVSSSLAISFAICVDTDY